MFLSELKTPPYPEILRYCYFKQVQRFKPLAEYIAHYMRAKLLESKADYSFEYLFEAANRYLLMKREDAMQEALSRGLMGTSDRAAPGIDPTPKGTGKGDKSKSERPESAPPRRRATGAGKGKPKSKSACFAFQTGTCTRGKDCGYAHAKETVRRRDPEKGTSLIHI